LASLFFRTLQPLAGLFAEFLHIQRAGGAAGNTFIPLLPKTLDVFLREFAGRPLGFSTDTMRSLFLMGNMLLLIGRQRGTLYSRH
jgi:hypothetical protein